MAKVFSVSDINKYIAGLLVDDFFLNNVVVTGEISNYNQRNYGNMVFFSIKDDASSIDCVIYDTRLTSLPADFAIGMKVIIKGRVSLYDKGGKCQIVCKDIKDAGKGELYEEFLKLKEELESAGYFDEGYKRPLPTFPRNIGLITAKGSQAEKDFLKNAGLRDPHLSINIFHATMQGTNAVPTVINGLDKLDEMDLDIIVIARGGGNYEDLNCFNNEKLAKRVFDCKTPIVSGIGHEGDYTIVDFVADYRASTPTAAAVAVSVDIKEMLSDLKNMDNAINKAVRSRVDNLELYLRERVARLKSLDPNIKLNSRSATLDKLGLSLDNAIARKLDRYTHQLERLDRFDDLINAYIEKTEKRFCIDISKLEALSPLKKMSQGYAFVSVDGHVLKSANQIDNGDEVVIDLVDGSVAATVTRKHMRNLNE